MYCAVFLILAFLLAIVSVSAWQEAGWLLWLVLDFVLLSIAYGRNDARLLGKRSTGTFLWWALVVYLPYFWLTRLLWHLVRQMSREPACDEIVSGLWIGRRPLSNDVPSGVSSIVDLTAEFSEPQRVRIGRTYRCLPILDTSIPEAEAFAKMVGEVAADGVLIHCAWGHGRSGLFAAAVLVARGLAATADDAIQQVRKARPRVRLNRAQRRFLIRYCESRAPTN